MIKRYKVYYQSQETKFWWGLYYATSQEDALAQARDDAGKQPSGSGGPHRDSYFIAEEVKEPHA